MNRLTIGKTLNNDIVISDDPTISRAHAELIIGEENFIVDLNSTNGTFVNGVKIVDKQKLNSLDVIRVGNSLVDWSAYMYDKTVIDFGVDKTIVEKIEEIPKTVDVKKIIPTSSQGMFNKPFSFNGRIRRLEYGLSIILFYLYVMLVVALLDGNFDEGVFYLFMIPGYVFFWSQGAKRCHDLGNSGWFQIIPFYGLWMLFANSDLGENEYGLNPKGLNYEKDIS